MITKKVRASIDEMLEGKIIPREVEEATMAETVTAFLRAMMDFGKFSCSLRYGSSSDKLTYFTDDEIEYLGGSERLNVKQVSDDGKGDVNERFVQAIPEEYPSIMVEPDSITFLEVYSVFIAEFPPEKVFRDVFINSYYQYRPPSEMKETPNGPVITRNFIPMIRIDYYNPTPTR
ncbi:MAG: hypothetical protein KJ709_06260 [Nanoarchaeota archaeon]|nr:hypothetical protein [Nanoarchaeota archaeon]